MDGWVCEGWRDDRQMGEGWIDRQMDRQTTYGLNLICQDVLLSTYLCYET